jgi:hypothetical protein
MSKFVAVLRSLTIFKDLLIRLLVRIFMRLRLIYSKNRYPKFKKEQQANQFLKTYQIYICMTEKVYCTVVHVYEKSCSKLFV